MARLSRHGVVALLKAASRALCAGARLLVAVAATITVSAAAQAQQPANNSRINAQRVHFDGSSNMWMMHFATSDGTVPSSCGGGNDQDVWFIATATATGDVWARVCYVDWAYTLQVFRSDSAHTRGAEVVCRTLPAGGGCGAAQVATWNALEGESFLIRAACDPQLFYGGGFTLTTGSGAPPAPVPPPTVEGADIVTGECWGVSSFGTQTVNGQAVRAFSIGADAWNRGAQTLAWQPGSSRHPVIAQNMYRDLEGRLDNVGISWLKHGFASENATRYGPCATPFGSGSTLGTNCADAYTASQNGGRDGLGPRWDVNPMTGAYTWNWSTIVGPTPTQTNVAGRRLQVPVADWANEGAEYWVDVHYVCSDDASWNNGRNNVSARRITTIPTSNTFTSTQIFNGSTTQKSTTALQAWAERVNAASPGAVQVSLVDFHELTQPALAVNGSPSATMKECFGQFQVYSRVTENGDGTWRYLYGVYNVNSHRAAGALSLRVPAGSVEAGYTFRAPLYHSGERIDNSPWTSAKSAGVQTFAFNPSYPPTMTITNLGTVSVQPNYIYWGSMYTFSFTSNVPPATETGTARLKLGRGPANATGHQGDTLVVSGLKVPTVCIADVGSQGGIAGPDGALDNNDFVGFIDAFFNSHLIVADIGGQGGVSGGDNTLDNNDFIVFIDAFFDGSGCL